MLEKETKIFCLIEKTKSKLLISISIVKTTFIQKYIKLLT